MDAGTLVKTGKLLAASGALASLLTLTLSGAAQANGVGDLYVASASGVLEVHVATSTIKETIHVSPSPQALAFSPDGTTLFSSGGGSEVTPIDIATLEVHQAITMPGPVAAIAFPAGQILVAVMPTRMTLAFAVVHGGAVTESAQLPGAGNLIAADRRDARVAVAEGGKSWLEVVDPATSTLRKTTVAGGIVALAIDRDHGGVLVATQNPNSLIRVDLTSLVATWTVKLSDVPAAVASMASTVVVSAGKQLWKVDGKTASAFATGREAPIALTASDEGQYVHAAEASGIEVFDTKGAILRTIELASDRAPLAMAPVVRGSSLYLGQGSTGSSSPKPNPTAPAALLTPVPPATSTVTSTALGIVGSPPFQGAVAVSVGILFLCWLFIRWYDKRAAGKS